MIYTVWASFCSGGRLPAAPYYFNSVSLLRVLLVGFRVDSVSNGCFSKGRSCGLVWLTCRTAFGISLACGGFDVSLGFCRSAVLRRPRVALRLHGFCLTILRRYPVWHSFYLTCSSHYRHQRWCYSLNDVRVVRCDLLRLKQWMRVVFLKHLLSCAGQLLHPVLFMIVG